MVSGVSMGAGARPDAAQFQAMRQQRFAQADGDGSGGLSLDEFKSMVTQGPGGPGGPGGAHGPGGPGGSPPVAPSDEQLSVDFEAWDRDGDGALSSSEWDAGFESKRAAMSTEAFAQASTDTGRGTAASDAGSQLLALLQALGVGQDGGTLTVSQTTSISWVV